MKGIAFFFSNTNILYIYCLLIANLRGVGRFWDRRIVDFCGKSSGLADFGTKWIVGQLSAVIPDCAGVMFGSWFLNEIWIIDRSSTLVGMLMSAFK